MTVIVDTNVPVVANGESEQASADCVEICAERLGAIMLGSKIQAEGWKNGRVEVEKEVNRWILGKN